MPGWHEATAELREQGRLQMVGIVEEQHAERARLFMQWKQMDWPLMVDSLDLLEVPVVPITVAIDEHGIVRKTGLRPGDAAVIEAEFVDREYGAPGGSAEPPPTAAADISRLKAEAITSGSGEAWRRYAQALTLWGGARRLDEAIQAYLSSVAVQEEHGYTHFRLGVALRARHDSPWREPADFQGAVEAWTRALEIDPNNYIWRRRIQQYGPRTEKPYPFYDWIRQAREEILAREEEPLALAVEPGAAELAVPLEMFEPQSVDGLKEPDPDERIHKDLGRFIRVETTVVPRVVRPGESARVHVSFEPRSESDAHWNNEAGDLRFWISPPDGWEVDRHSLTVPNPADRTSLETRTVEFEVRLPEDARAGARTLPAYGLYYVCEGEQGACLYRRQNVPVRVVVRGKS